MKKQYVSGYGNVKKSGREKITMAILFGVCIAAALITFLTVGLIRNMSSDNQVSYTAEADDNVVVNNEDIEDAYVEEETLAEPETEEEAPDDEYVHSVEVSGEIIEETITFCKPCSGIVINDYSPDIPVYSKTLEDWRVHNGIDISSPLGGEVVSIADGTVQNVTEDLMYGFTIVIEHKDGLRSIYSNLAGTDGVKIGRQVKKGEVIARVGDTALFETIADTHLHIEVTKDGAYVNPLDYFVLM